ncbi:MAG: DoxX family protein [Pseudomonadota bacterium]
MIKVILRILLAIIYAFAGYMHIVRPGPFLSIMPGPVPFPEQVIFWTGLAEILGAIAIIQPLHPRLRQAGGIGLALYALCVWPANINHFILDMGREDSGLGLAYHVPRMFAQPVIIWLALWVGDVPIPRQRPEQ